MTNLRDIVGRRLERHNLPAWGWGAKGFEFWTFLSLLLVRSECSRILELGSGRSTILFNEYAKFRDASVTSIETDRRWFNKARMELRWQSLPVDSIHLVDIRSSTGWYDVDAFHALTRRRDPFDFVLIDGPNEGGGDSKGIRDGVTAMREISACCANADIVIVDDVHRRHVLTSVDPMLSDPERYEKWFYDYPVQERYANSLCICVRRGSTAAANLRGLRDQVGLRLYDSFPLDACSED